MYSDKISTNINFTKDDKLKYKKIVRSGLVTFGSTIGFGVSVGFAVSNPLGWIVAGSFAVVGIVAAIVSMKNVFSKKNIVYVSAKMTNMLISNLISLKNQLECIDNRKTDVQKVIEKESIRYKNLIPQI